MIDFGFLTAWKSKAMALQASCTTDSDSECRDETIALHLKLIAILSILFAGALGIALPLLGKKLMVLKTDGPFFTIVKAFAAGVILATGFVHILPNATAALTDSCLPDFPWQDFPFSGCIAMLAALCTLMVDVLGTEYYEKKQAKEREETQEDIGATPSDAVVNDKDTKNMHVVGIHAHAASHSHILPSGMYDDSIWATFIYVFTACVHMKCWDALISGGESEEHNGFTKHKWFE